MNYISCSGYFMSQGATGCSFRFYGRFKSVERLWKFIKLKYPNLRVTGFHIHAEHDEGLRQFIQSTEHHTHPEK